VIARLRAGGPPLIGTWIKIRALETVELLAIAGLDFMIIDLEHSPSDLDWAFTATVAAQGAGISVLVRVSDSTAPDLQRLLDIGIDGILVPQIRAASEVRKVIGRATFPPDGTRGVGLTSRAGHWGVRTLDEYLDRGRNEVLLGIQFETPEAFTELDEILDVPNLSSVFLGPADLALATGVPPGDPSLMHYSERLVERGRDHGIAVGTAVGSVLAAVEAAAAGFGYIAVSTDATLFASAAVEAVGQIKASLA
jgi:2-keto-3-deoxy-L-rhamnonate aldolase RhmA